MKPSQTRAKIVEEWKENMRIGLGLDDEDVEVAKNHLTQALNDYTESIVRMVEGMKFDIDGRRIENFGKPIQEGEVLNNNKWHLESYDQAIDDIIKRLEEDK